VWTVLLVGLPLLADWLEQFWGSTAWALPAAGFLLVVARMAQVYMTGGPSGNELPAGVSGEAPEARGERSQVHRLLWGG
jgi:hypothetical protein